MRSIPVDLQSPNDWRRNCEEAANLPHLSFNFPCRQSLYLLYHGRVLLLVLFLYTLETFRARLLPLLIIRMFVTHCNLCEQKVTQRNDTTLIFLRCVSQQEKFLLLYFVLFFVERSVA